MTFNSITFHICVCTLKIVIMFIGASTLWGIWFIGHLLHINSVSILYVNPVIINVSFTAFDVKTYVLDTQQGHNAYMPNIYFYIEIKDDRKLG